MRKIIKGPKVTWVDIRKPDKKDVQYLKKKYNFHPLILGELIPPSYRSKIDRFDDYIFMVLYYPVYSKEKRETRPRELDVIITKDTIITNHYKSIVPLRALFDKCNLYPESKNTHMSDGPGGLLFFILDGVWKNCLIKLNRIDRRMDKIEEDIFREKEREMVKEISLVKTDIINFWRIIDPQIKTLESFLKEGTNFLGKKYTPHFSDILGTYYQARHKVQTYKETILALEDTNQSLLSTKTGETMKVLTVFSVIFLPLTLLASLLGMNVAIPTTNSSLDFWIILVAMFLLVALMLFIFYRKKWL